MPTKSPGGAITFYSDQEKKVALELASRIGSSAAARQLHIGGGSSRIAKWKSEFPEYWSDLQSGAHVAPARRSRTAENLEDLAEAYTDLEFEALKRAEKLIRSADAKGLAALMRAMGSSRNTATGGARAYRGEDVQTVEHNINFEALEKAAEAILARAPAPPILVENLAEAEESHEEE